MAQDSVTAILNNEPLHDWHDNDIFSAYLATIYVQTEDYRRFVAQEYRLFEQNFVPYFAEYKKAFIAQRSTKISLEKIDQAKEKNKAILFSSPFSCTEGLMASFVTFSIIINPFVLNKMIRYPLFFYTFVPSSPCCGQEDKTAAPIKYRLLFGIHRRPS